MVCQSRSLQDFKQCVSDNVFQAICFRRSVSGDLFQVIWNRTTNKKAGSLRSGEKRSDRIRDVSRCHSHTVLRSS